VLDDLPNLVAHDAAVPDEVAGEQTRLDLRWDVKCGLADHLVPSASWGTRWVPSLPLAITALAISD